MAFGENIQEIILRIKAEGAGEADKVRQMMADIRQQVEGLYGTIASAPDPKGLLSIFRDIGQADKDVGVLEKHLASLGESEVANAKSVAAARSEIEKQEKVEREANLKEASARIRQAAKEQKDAEKSAQLEMTQAEREASAERERIRREELAAVRAAAHEKAAVEKAALKELIALERQETIERQHNLKEAEHAATRSAQKEIQERENVARLKLAMTKVDADRIKETRREEETERDYDIRKDLDRLGRVDRAAEQGRQASQKFGYALLNISHAVQDAQYGFGAVLNNIPLVVSAFDPLLSKIPLVTTLFGGTMGLAGAAMIAGVGLSVFGDKVKSVARDIGLIRNPANEAAISIDQMKEKIAAMVEKPWKVDIDFRSIERAQEQLDVLEARRAALDAAIKKQTPMQQKVGEVVLGAVSQFAGAADEAGGTLNLMKIVAEVAQQTGVVDQFMKDDPRAKKLDISRRLSEAIPMPGMDAAQAFSIEMGARAAKADADALEAEIRTTARNSAVDQSISSALRGGPQGVQNLLGVLGTEEGKRLAKEGDKKLGILPVDKSLMNRLREATPERIEVAEDSEQEEVANDQVLADQIASMKAARQARQQAVRQEISSLASGKATKLESPLADAILERIEAGGSRPDILASMGPDVLRRMGPVKNAKPAADKVLRQVMEKVYTDVMAAMGEGIDEKKAAGFVRKDLAAEIAAKADRERKKEGRILEDPVTGLPVTEADKEGMKLRDKEGKDFINQALRREKLSATPAGRRALAREADGGWTRERQEQRTANARQYVAQRFGLNAGQAVVVAKRGMALEDEGWRGDAAQQAYDELAMRNRRMMRQGEPRDRKARAGRFGKPRGGAGFRSIAPSAEGGGDAIGTAVGLQQQSIAVMGGLAGVAGQTQGRVSQVGAQQQAQAQQLAALARGVQQLSDWRGVMRIKQPTLLTNPMPAATR